jgi:hypothetical protein
MRSRRIVVATHGHCFDGMASAALFTTLLRRLYPGQDLQFRVLSCGYGPNMSTVPEGWLDGDENAILDFRYTRTDRLTWYFDHHLTAFGSDEERRAALAGASASKDAAPHVHYDPACGSCSKLLFDTASRVYGVDLGDLGELVRWADLIDTAGFASAADAVRRDEPVLQLASVVEQHGDRAFLEAVVPMLAERGVVDVAKDPWIQGLWAPISITHAALMTRVKERSRREGRVVVTDLSDAPPETTAKFISYALYPEGMYSVTLSRSKQHFKVAVGYNPWCGAPRLHNIAAICKRYGGGGHPVVGAATFKLSDERLARAAVAEITRELQS